MTESDPKPVAHQQILLDDAGDPPDIDAELNALAATAAPGASACRC